MNIIITGGAGFLGQRLARALLETRAVTNLTLVDVVVPPKPSVSATDSAEVRCICADLTDKNVLDTLITDQTTLIYHLAAIVSGHAESDFDLGNQVNFEVTHHLLEKIRHTKPQIKFIFSSSLAVFGGNLPAVITDMTATTPSSSYGTQKAMCELLINDYSRKGFVDGLVLRLPTISVREGKPNKAASSFVSGIIREPLNGETAVCPVATDLKVWISSPDQVIQNFVHAMTLNLADFSQYRVINLPGISVSILEMIRTLAALSDTKTTQLITYIPDPNVQKIVESWPCAFDISTALRYGFRADQDIAAIISQYIFPSPLKILPC